MAMPTRMRSLFPRNFFDIMLKNVKSCSKIECFVTYIVYCHYKVERKRTKRCHCVYLNVSHRCFFLYFGLPQPAGLLAE